MTYKYARVRLASTAIAAVLAFSANPLSAQETPTPPDAAQTSPAPAPATSADPLAPQADAPVVDAPPVVSDSAAAPAKATAAKTSHAAVKRTATTARAAAPAAAPAPAPVAQAAPPAASAQPAPADTAQPAQSPAPPPVAEPSAARQTEMNDILPIGGGALLALVGLAGVAVGMRRRRRRRDELAAEENWTGDEDVAVVDEEPAMESGPVAEPEVMGTAAAAPMAAARPEPRHDPVDEAAPATALPEGFDLSRFGPHVQAAYRGPTKDNPSLSLRYRLRRAAAMDQRERMDREARVEQPGPGDGGFMLHDEERTAPEVRPEYSD